MPGLAALLLALCCLVVAPAAAEPPAALTLAGDGASFSLTGHLAVLEDASGTAGIDDVAGRGEFRTVASSASQPRLGTETLWYRFTVLRAAGMPSEWVLAFGEPDINDVRVFVPLQTGGFREIRLGRRFPSRQLSLAARRHVAMLELPEGPPVTVYLRLASDRKIRFEAAELWRPGALVFAEARQSVLLALQFAIPAVILVVTLLFGVWLRDGPMLAYALYVATTLCRGISHSAIVTLVFPDAGGDTNYLLTGGGLLGGVAAFIFMWDKILELKTTFPLMHRIYMLVSAVVALSLLSVLSPSFPRFVEPAQVIMLVASLSSIVLAALLLRRNRKDILLAFYLCAFLPIALVWGVEIAARLSPLVPLDLGRRIDLVTGMSHIAILSVALAYRLGRMQRERIRADVALAGERLARQRLRTFIDMATHEFKTPLATIDSAAQVLELLVDCDRPAIASRLEVIRRSVRRVIDLVDICLTGERTEDLSAKFEGVVPADMLQRVVERNRGENSDKLRLATAGLPAEWVADPGLLGIALDALIDNARRYGAADQVIDITATANQKSILLAVCDRGPGVAADEVERVFEKYYRGARNGAVPGTGIGLHLVRAVAELHGGTVSYQPRPGGGAVFQMALPLVLA